MDLPFEAIETFCVGDVGESIPICAAPLKFVSIGLLSLLINLLSLLMRPRSIVDCRGGQSVA